jgi:chromosome segregation and condensation protein ScpB/DNA-binding XRE family transcriptional regulator
MSQQPSPDHDHLGFTLRTRRGVVRLTLQELADQVGVSAGQLSRIETGKSQPSYETLVRLHHALGLDSTEMQRAIPIPRPAPDDALIPRLGALLTVRRSISLVEAGVILGVSIAALQAALVELAQRLASVGMLVVEDGTSIALVPHRAFGDIADRAASAEVVPRLTGAHREVIAAIVHGGSVASRRIDELRGIDSSETVAQLVEWGIVRRDGRDREDARAPRYTVTAKLLELTGTTSIAELRQGLLELAGMAVPLSSPKPR